MKWLIALMLLCFGGAQAHAQEVPWVPYSERVGPSWFWSEHLEEVVQLPSMVAGYNDDGRSQCSSMWEFWNHYWSECYEDIHCWMDHPEPTVPNCREPGVWLTAPCEASDGHCDLETADE